MIKIYFFYSNNINNNIKKTYLINCNSIIKKLLNLNYNKLNINI